MRRDGRISCTRFPVPVNSTYPVHAGRRLPWESTKSFLSVMSAVIRKSNHSRAALGSRPFPSPPPIVVQRRERKSPHRVAQPRRMEWSGGCRREVCNKGQAALYRRPDPHPHLGTRGRSEEVLHRDPHPGNGTPRWTVVFRRRWIPRPRSHQQLPGRRRRRSLLIHPSLARTYALPPRAGGRFHVAFES